MFANSLSQAFWLRSSVVSVLFSLISEITVRGETLINLIFGSSRSNPSVLAQWISGTVSEALHCRLVTQIHLFIIPLSWSRGLEKRVGAESSSRNMLRNEVIPE
jgi:hypothetical protein